MPEMEASDSWVMYWWVSIAIALPFCLGYVTTLKQWRSRPAQAAMASVIIEGIANFDIRAGKTTYIGQLSISPDFKQDQRSVQAQVNIGVIPRNLPEAVLAMRGSATDRKAGSLQAIAQDKAAQPIQIDTSLMFVDKRDKWDCAQSPPPPPPAGVQKKR